jgi:hypothetical protein
MNKKLESRNQRIGAGTAILEPEGSPEASLSQEDIAALAYSYWEGRGYKGGSPEEDWLRAETELRGRPSQGKP